MDRQSRPRKRAAPDNNASVQAAAPYNAAVQAAAPYNAAVQAAAPYNAAVQAAAAPVNAPAQVAAPIAAPIKRARREVDLCSPETARRPMILRSKNWKVNFPCKATQCAAMTKSGVQCSRKRRLGHYMCWQHEAIAKKESEAPQHPQPAPQPAQAAAPNKAQENTPVPQQVKHPQPAPNNARPAAPNKAQENTPVQQQVKFLRKDFAALTANTPKRTPVKGPKQTSTPKKDDDEEGKIEYTDWYTLEPDQYQFLKDRVTFDVLSAESGALVKLDGPKLVDRKFKVVITVNGTKRACDELEDALSHYLCHIFWPEKHGKPKPKKAQYCHYCNKLEDLDLSPVKVS